jgi:NAD(P)-dependent dehydrogenase (short-subunit alcohol dehydrogenase family)/rhamnose utilization protein RhaD (predicted bifunctional aldolase and dehydrogenase)
MARQELAALAAASRRYGGDLEFVFLGGGNTSVKTADTLYIKPSGVRLAEIDATDFIPMSRGGIRRLFAADMPAGSGEREALVKDMMASCVQPPGVGRPSVEAPLHELMEYKYVVHLHPAKVNGMTCAVAGEETCRRLFPEALWVDYIDPGATLALAMKEVYDGLGRQPQVVFLQNHGVFVAADTIEESENHSTAMMGRLEECYAAAGVPVLLRQEEPELAAAAELLPTLRGLLADSGSLPLLHTAARSFEVADGPLTPDHMVYARAFPCAVGDSGAEVQAYRRGRGMSPRLLVLPGGAICGVGGSLQSAEGVLVAARDAALVRQLTEAFGGPRYLGDRERLFIENWEVESYRQKVASASGEGKRAAGKVCVVTGGAQGFGLGIAEGLVENGATVVLADLNLPGAEDSAAAINDKAGRRAALALEVNIADEGSVERMVRSLVLACGGLDLLVANAGVLKAGSVKTFDLNDWELVTNVNYTGYFLCAKHVSRAMAAQNAACPGHWSDIIQINSKSGLEGSNKNGAYAGSKFGTIGLTQSFAKELVTDRIKVNSVCPGNFFDGPLWSDPERGLFKQYLDSGKVPGAKTVADVKRFYEAKVPVGRGCYPSDVLKAILYLVEQEYETGQALPVTGGQVMLN